MHNFFVINFKVIRYKIVKKTCIFFLSICSNNHEKLEGIHKHIFKE